MQNWYSQKSPLRSKGVEVGRTVGNGAGVFVPIEARVVAIASSIGMPGVDGGRIPGREQDVKRSTSNSTYKKCLIR
jgi:hypothetical protein